MTIIKNRWTQSLFVQHSKFTKWMPIVSIIILKSVFEVTTREILKIISIFRTQTTDFKHYINISNTNVSYYCLANAYNQNSYWFSKCTKMTTVTKLKYWSWKHMVFFKLKTRVLNYSMYVIILFYRFKILFWTIRCILLCKSTNLSNVFCLYVLKKTRTTSPNFTWA